MRDLEEWKLGSVKRFGVGRESLDNMFLFASEV